MSTLGVIVEYNPFHNGHLYHLNEAKKMTNAQTTIAVMSGSFLQRGEPALIDKWTRAKMALLQGVDLVIEIPTVYATQAADWFAFGSTHLLHHLKVDHLVFGSETDSVEILDQISEVLLREPTRLKSYIKEELSLGNSYPKALSLSLKRYFANSSYEISKPNDILGIQYLLQLKKLKSPITAHTIKRIQANYHDQQFTDNPIASATAIRKNIFESNNSIKGIKSKVPTSTYNLLQEAADNQRLNHWDNFLSPLLIITNGRNDNQLKSIHGMIEGFERRLKDHIYHQDSFSQLLNTLKTKRYTSTKIQRTLLYTLLDLTEKKIEDLALEAGPQYIRVLGFNDIGRAYLSQIKHHLELPLVTNISREKPAMLEVDIVASNIYELGFHQPAFRKKEFKQSPIYLK